jgi:ferredoxin-NADP reductase
VTEVPPAPRAIDWQLATITAVRDETPTVRTFTLGLHGWAGHRAGQHVDLRLTAEDGYSVERSYSIASEPERSGEIDVTVERIPGGEVSPFLHEVAVPGDRLEIRGPIGGYFVWEPEIGGPIFLVAGGSGVVPLMAMLRTRATAPASTRASVAATLLYSSRGWDDVFYRDELARLTSDPNVRVIHTLTRSQPPGWTGFTRRIDADMLAETAPDPSLEPHIYVCGPTALVESAAQTLVDLGHDPSRVKTERFGPTG